MEIVLQRLADVDWDTCTKFDPAREYLRRLDSHESQGELIDSDVINPWLWDPLFLRQVKDRQSVVAGLQSDSLCKHDFPLLRFPRLPMATFAANPVLHKPRLVANFADELRIAIMTSNSDSAVKSLLSICRGGEAPHLAICCLFSCQPAKTSPFDNNFFANMPFPVIHKSPYPIIYDDWDYRWQHYFEEVTHNILRECPDVIILVGWTLKLEQPFLNAMKRPRIITGVKHYLPVPLVWIQPHLPEHHASPGDLKSASEWAYGAFQTGDIVESGFTVSQFTKRGFKMHHLRRVDMRKEESLQDFQTRMQDIQGEVAVGAAVTFLRGLYSLAC
ncbi:hypothetical protein K439DRAFT_185209 [Ramaria rubella]|nr:hypothetical protein K439DRAFT_185209 [Ramaria rubella]